MSYNSNNSLSYFEHKCSPFDFCWFYTILDVFWTSLIVMWLVYKSKSQFQETFSTTWFSINSFWTSYSFVLVVKGRKMSFVKFKKKKAEENFSKMRILSKWNVLSKSWTSRVSNFGFRLTNLLNIFWKENGEWTNLNTK